MAANKRPWVLTPAVERYDLDIQQMPRRPAVGVFAPQSVDDSLAEVLLDTRDLETALAELMLKLTDREGIDVGDDFVHFEVVRGLWACAVMVALLLIEE